MKALLRALKWLLTALVFFLLFAFALNNQEKVQVHLIFGWSGQTPLVLVILFSFALGMVVGVLGMLPHWWRQRRNSDPLVSSGLDAQSTFGLSVKGSTPTSKSSNDFDYGP